MEDSDRQERIEKLMREPTPLEVTNYEEKIRRNLLIASMIVFALTYLQLVPASDSKFFGLSFDNLTPKSIYIILLIIISYELIHYVWLILNKLAYWRVRLTGTNPGVSRGNGGMRFGSEFDPEDYSGEQENSTFYVWMLDSKRSFKEVFQSYDSKWNSIEIATFDNQSLDQKTAEDILKKLNEISQIQSRLEGHVTNIRIEASFNRFEKWYSMMIRSQSLRWIILDFLLPILGGFGALGALLYRWYGL